MAVTRRSAHRLRAKWLAHAPHLWWGDRLDSRFVVVDALQGVAGARVLDVGCNAGIMLSEVPRGNQCFGLDRSAETLRAAAAILPHAPLVAGDMLALPYRAASFDVLLFCGMIELPPPHEKPHAVQELARVLRPGGRLYLTTPNRRYRRVPDTHRVTRSELQSLLAPYFDARVRGFNPVPAVVPNRVLARVPGIWRALTALMQRDIGVDASCSLYCEAVRR